MQPHWSIIDHMTHAISTVERHHSPAVQFRLILSHSHHCTLTSLTMYTVYDEVSDVAVQRYQWIKQNCTPRHNKHKAWYAWRMVYAWFAACLIVRAHYRQFHQLKTNKKLLKFRPRKTVLSPLTSEVLYKTYSEWSLFVQWNKILHSVKDETLHSTRLRLVEYSVSYLSPRANLVPLHSWPFTICILSITTSGLHFYQQILHPSLFKDP